MRIANDNPVEQDGQVSDDVIIPFQLQESGLRGRAVRLGKVLDDILNRHDYPLAISLLVAETVTLAVTLSSMLKYDGIFTLQTSGKGVVKTLIADMRSDGAVRGCASFDADGFAALDKVGGGIYDGYRLKDLTGEGYIAFTVDQGAHTERYQGIVALEGDRLQESISHYFEQSEQLRTCIYLAAEKQVDRWRSGALMLQYLPDDHAEDNTIVAFNEKSESERKEDWVRSKTLLQTCTDKEILNYNLHVNELLRRLFHEEGVIVYTPKPIHHECRCSEEKVRNVIDSLSDDDKRHAATDEGVIEMTCEFCSKTYIIPV